MTVNLPGDEILTDDILRGLINDKVTILHNGISDCDLLIKDVSTSYVWVLQGINTYAKPIALSDIVSVTHTEQVRHRYVNSDKK